MQVWEPVVQEPVPDPVRNPVWETPVGHSTRQPTRGWTQVPTPVWLTAPVLVLVQVLVLVMTLVWVREQERPTHATSACLSYKPTESRQTHRYKHHCKRR